MTPTERARRARIVNLSRRMFVTAALVAGATSSCSDQPAETPAATSTPPTNPGEGVRPATAAPPTVVTLPRPARRPATRPTPRSHTGSHTSDVATAASITPSGWRRLGTLDVTAYCYTGSRTASGVWPARGQVATLAPIPFGTHLRLRGLGIYEVTDRIGWGSDVDIYFPSCVDARNFGRRHLTVWQEAAA